MSKNNNTNGKRNYNKDKAGSSNSGKKDNRTSKKLETRSKSSAVSMADVFSSSPTFLDSTRVNSVVKANSVVDINPNGNYTHNARVGAHYNNIMTIQYAPSLGHTTGWSDAINRSWMSIYNAYASKTTGTIPFGFMDLAMMTCATDSLVILISEAIRALSVGTAYSVIDREAPKSLLKALWLDESWMKDRDSIRADLNIIIKDFNSLNLPAYLKSVIRRRYLAENVFCEYDGSPLDHLYAFVSTGFYEFDDVNSICNFVGWEDNLYSPSHGSFNGSPNYPITRERGPEDYFVVIRHLIDTIRSSGAYHQISSAVIRAFGDQGTIKYDYVLEDQFVSIIPDESILIQIMNSKAMYYVEHNEVNQGTVANTLTCLPRHGQMQQVASKIKASLLAPNGNIMLASPNVDFGNSDVMNACILQPQYVSHYYPGDASTPSDVDVRGLLEIVLQYEVYNGGDSARIKFLNAFHDHASMHDVLSRLRGFRYYPCLCVYTTTGSGDEAEYNIATISFPPGANKIIVEDIKLLRDVQESAKDSVYTISDSLGVL